MHVEERKVSTDLGPYYRVGLLEDRDGTVTDAWLPDAATAFIGVADLSH